MGKKKVSYGRAALKVLPSLFIPPTNISQIHCLATSLNRESHLLKNSPNTEDQPLPGGLLAWHSQKSKDWAQAILPKPFPPGTLHHILNIKSLPKALLCKNPGNSLKKGPSHLAHTSTGLCTLTWAGGSTLPHCREMSLLKVPPSLTYPHGQDSSLQMDKQL